MSSLPNPPFDSWLPDAVDPAYGFAWYTEPATFVSQANFEHTTADHMRLLMDWIDLVVAARSDDIKAHGGMRFVHDSRVCRSVHKDARQVVVQRMRLRPKGYARETVVVIDARASGFLRMGIGALTLASGLMMRAPLQLTEDVKLLEALQPPTTALFPTLLAAR